ncbi:uncharacterized protein MELLADRAFT_90598 [Melampsora larici-populina 98AG31]|uniref:Uncharacterized protein n=1 Tax=Melampsora larici-populina (strain 98AG31 / pathotype 3-4-7) TaxID=747676 RepID=F4RXG9_MELLP|nr:uncharacterized protein MELLADRAFT_90598 [Melampsora larici-populina 98AG31]EGG02989.1 hypothetical protein MELLADRAFT_90598 [Melampsora larici-populina 98AG31]
MFRPSSKQDMLPFTKSDTTSKRLLSTKPRRKRSRSSSGLPPAIYDILYTYPASFRNLILVLLIGSILFWISTNVLVLMRFLLVDTLFSNGLLGKTHLALRKQPLIFIHSPWSATIVWETNQNRTDEHHHCKKGVGLRYWKSSKVGDLQYTGQSALTIPLVEKMSKMIVPRVEVVQPDGYGNQNRWIHSVLLDNLEPGMNYGYELFLESNQRDINNPKIPESIKSYGEFEFTWLGMNPPNPANLDHISSTSPTSNHTVSSFHMAIIGDTYSNPRGLHSLAKKYLDLKSYVPLPTSVFRPRKITDHFKSQPTKPHALIHLGNAVSNPEDHREWQTGFWDPLTFQQSASSEVPILYGRGPHDFDKNGSSLYTGGLPGVQLGEVNRTRVALLKNQSNRIILPGFAVAERQYTAIQTPKRDRRTRASFIGYSPHPRIRILVLDPNLVPERQAFIGSRSTLTELGDHEHWLLWEMARPEWKEASIRLIVVNVPAFPEFVDPLSWAEGHQNNWETYVRTTFAPHFHGISAIARQFDIPPATMVISSQPAAYYRGLLQNYLAQDYVNAVTPDQISSATKHAAYVQHYSTSDPHSPHPEEGVIYVSVPGQRPKGKPHEPAEHWGFYEVASDFSKRSHSPLSFSSLSFDLSPDGYQSKSDLTTDWDENLKRREEFDHQNIRLYHMIGSQSTCDKNHTHLWKPNLVYGIAYDRLYFRIMTSKGKVLDQFVVEAAACRS